MNRNHVIIATATLLFFLSAVIETGAQPTIWKVKTAGAMRDMFETGNIDGKTEIGKLEPQSGLYGLGPLDKLSGEIMIWDGQPLTSFMSGDEVKVLINKDAKAVFFVWTNVTKWKEFRVPANVRTYEDLDKFIGQTAASAKFSDVAPVPFLLKGKFERVDWHVNNYKPDNEKITHEKHDALKVKRTTTNETLEMLGFYSTRHAGVFVHHSRSSHIHVTNAARSFVGHVDELTAGDGIVLLLPAS